MVKSKKKKNKLLEFVLKNKICIIATITLIILFVLSGKNIWAEIIAEYLPYAISDIKMESFAGYLTLFPYFVAKAYYYIPLLENIMTWASFATVISFIYTLLCVYSTILIAKKKLNDKYIVILLAIILLLLVHPSVSNLINITHFGYIPIILHIILCIFDKNFDEEVGNIPKLSFVCLFLSIISKPSLSFLPFFFVLIFTKIWKRKLSFIMILLSTVASAYQTFLFSSSASSLMISSIKGIINYIVVALQNVGSIFVFPFSYYIVNWNSNMQIIYSVICIILAVVFIGCILYYLLKQNWIQKNYWNIIKKIIILGSLVLVVVFPYTTVNCEMDLWEVLKSGLYSSFSKYKLQYQLTSTIVGISFILIVLSKTQNHKLSKVLYIIIACLSINGMLSAICASSWLNVRFINNGKINFYNEAVYLYAPYGEWNYDLTPANSGWSRGNTVYKFYDKPIKVGGEYQKLNPIFLESLPNDYRELHLYLVYSDQSIKFKNETNWLDYLSKKNSTKEILIKTDSEELKLKFSKSTAYSTRYSLYDYNQEFIEDLYNGNFKIYDGKKEVSTNNLNIIVVWG